MIATPQGPAGGGGGGWKEQERWEEQPDGSENGKVWRGEGGGKMRRLERRENGVEPRG